MHKILLTLFLFIVSACSLSEPFFPEEYLLTAHEITSDDLDIILQTGFDLTSQSPDGTVYLAYLLSHPEPTTLEILKTLLDKKIIRPRTVFKDGRTLLNYVLDNPGDISLQMTKFLLEGKDKVFFLDSPYNPLFNAIANKGKISFSLISYLTKNGFNINTPDPKTGTTPVMEFMRSYPHDIPQLQEYMVENLNIYIKDNNARNIWHYLLANPYETLYTLFERLYDRKDLQKLLILPDKNKVYPIFYLVANPGKDVFHFYTKIKEVYTPLFSKPEWINSLFLASLSNTGKGLQPLFKDILHYRPNVNAQNDLGQNSLIVLTQNTGDNLGPVIDTLIRERVNIYQLDKQNRSALYYAVMNKGKHAAELLSFLERQGVSLAVADESGRTLMSYATLNQGPSGTKILNLLMEKGLPAITPDKEGLTPMALLFKNPSEEAISMIRALIYANYQGKPNEPFSNNIMFSAAQSTSPYAYKMMLIIIQQGFNINPQNTARQNPLFYTTQNPGPDALRMTRLLLMKGLSAHTVDRDGNTLLHYALDNPSHAYSMVNLLLKWGTDPKRKNVSGVSAFSLIQKMKPKEKERYKQILLRNHLEIQGL